MSTADEIAAEKAALRNVVMRELREMSTADRAQHSEIICARILSSDAWSEANNVLLFAPMLSEPEIARLTYAAQLAGKQPAIIPSTVRVESELHLPFKPDLIVVPGVAFSWDGRRMGRGGGFYDRLLAGRARKAFKLGVCFALQLRDAIPHASHDVLLDAVISEV